MSGNHRSFSSSSSSGYSLIEVLIVISVMILLSSMALTRVVTSMRTAAVSRAMSHIRETASQAQARAMNTTMGIGQAYPGVLIAKQDGRWQVGLVEAAAGSAASVTFADAVADEQGRAAVHQLSSGVRMWLGTSVAQDSDSLTWFYEPSTGRVVVPQSGGFSGPGAMIGYDPPPIFDSSGVPLVFGARPGFTVLNALHSPDGLTPGVSFRSADQRTKYSLAVLPSGILNLEEWQ